MREAWLVQGEKRERTPSSSATTPPLPPPISQRATINTTPHPQTELRRKKSQIRKSITKVLKKKEKKKITNLAAPTQLKKFKSFISFS